MMKLTEQEIEWFRALQLDRQHSAEVLKKPSMQGRSANQGSKKYRDSGHAILELLQNADDAGAREASFELSSIGLVFKHDGKVSFSITDPSNEALRPLGSINAITSFGNNDKSDRSRIGKFGIGFKSIDRFCEIPHIYSQTVDFTITDGCVPALLDHDHPNRKSNETMFWFPYRSGNHSEFENELTKKLKELKHPTLFLNSLGTIRWKSQSEQGKYKIERNEKSQASKVQNLVSIRQEGKSRVKTKFLLFEDQVKDLNGGYRTLQLAYDLNDTGKIRAETQQPLHCFFPTEQKIGAHFWLQAPFAIMDDRARFADADNQYNTQLIEGLLKLVVESMRWLKDARRFDLAAWQCFTFEHSNEGDWAKLIAKGILEELKTGNYLSDRNNQPIPEGVSATIAVKNTRVITLFPDSDDHKWCFNETLVFKESNLHRYLVTHRIATEFNAVTFLEYEEFKIKDLKRCQLLLDLLRDPGYNQKAEQFSHLPILIATDKEKKYLVKPSFDKNRLYLPSNPTFEADDIYFIHQDLAANPDYTSLWATWGIKEVNAETRLSKQILPALKNKPDPENFKRLLKQLHDTPLLIGKIREDVSGIACIPTQSGSWQYPTNIIVPDEQWQALFGNSYLDFINADIRIFSNDLDRDTTLSKIGVQIPKSIISRSEESGLLDEEYDWLCNQPTKNPKKETTSIKRSEIVGISKLKWGDFEIAKSLALMTLLIRSIPIHLKYHDQSLFDHLKDEIKYKRTVQRVNTRDGILKSGKVLESLTWIDWLIGADEKCYDPQEISVQELHHLYGPLLEDKRALKLLHELGMESADPEKGYSLAKRIGEKFLASGLTESDLELLLESKVEKEAKELEKQEKKNIASNENLTPIGESVENRITTNREAIANGQPLTGGNQIQITQAAAQRASYEQKKLELEQNIEVFNKYSMDWFRNLARLEAMLQGEQNPKVGKAIKLRFNDIRRDSARTIILSNPERPIPYAIEETTDFKVELETGANIKRYLSRPSMSRRDFSLILTFQHENEVPSGVELVGATCVIEIQDASFLQDLQANAFAKWQDDAPVVLGDFCLQQSLPEDIDFIFGPPGTGKTQTLALRLLEEQIKAEKQGEQRRVLVLAPTNKAADVLTERIHKLAEERDIVPDLYRFGSCPENLLVYRYQDEQMARKPRYILVTTSVRFFFDSLFLTHSTKGPLEGLQWEHICFDEASMIDIGTATYIAHKARGPLVEGSETRPHFTFAGDPFQLQPIRQAEAWQGENIYTLVGLSDFENPKTVPHNFDVQCLNIQYRAVPILGNIFSHFCYSGLLTHHRIETGGVKLPGLKSSTSLLQIHVPFEPKPLYKARKLSHISHYQLYTAVFCVEYIKKILSATTVANRQSIGVICPYKAQATLVNELIRQAGYSMDIEVSTVHSFQGDERDIIIALINRPNHSSPRASINNTNLLNVAVSRARNAMIILVPSTEVTEWDNLNRLNTLISKAAKTIKAEQLESDIWGTKTYIDRITSVGQHFQVNVYDEAQKAYDFKINEEAIDVLVHRSETISIEKL